MIKQKLSKGVWLSRELIQDKRLGMTQKIILQEISQLIDLEYGCIANNKHFAELLNISPQAVSNAINKLKNDGYINIDSSDTIRNFGRKITIHENVESIHENVETPIHENVESKDTNTNNTNTKEEKTNKKKKETYPDIIETWVEYRKEIKKPLTQTSIKALVKKYLVNPELFTRSVNSSIENGYQGLFEPKSGNPYQNNKTEDALAEWAKSREVVEVEVIDD